MSRKGDKFHYKPSCPRCKEFVDNSAIFAAFGICFRCFVAEARAKKAKDAPCVFCGETTKWWDAEIQAPTCLLCAWISHYNSIADKVLACNDSSGHGEVW